MNRTDRIRHLIANASTEGERTAAEAAYARVTATQVRAAARDARIRRAYSLGTSWGIRGGAVDITA